MTTQPPTTGPTTRLYQVLDLVAQQVAGPIINARHAAVATRIFHDTLKNEDTSLHEHPDDYALVELGVQEDATGAITPHLPPQIVTTGAIWKAAQN